jgi:hypothetical protein
MNQHDGDILTLQFPFLHIKRWKGQDVAVSANRCEVLEELIGHRDTRRLATVIDPHKVDTHIAVIRQIVGESADSLAKFVAVGCRLRSLCPI